MKGLLEQATVSTQVAARSLLLDTFPPFSPTSPPASLRLMPTLLGLLAPVMLRRGRTCNSHTVATRSGVGGGERNGAMPLPPCHHGSMIETVITSIVVGFDEDSLNFCTASSTKFVIRQSPLTALPAEILLALRGQKLSLFDRKK